MQVMQTTPYFRCVKKINLVLYLIIYSVFFVVFKENNLIYFVFVYVYRNENHKIMI